MILQCKNKKEFNATVKKYRSDGFNIISFWKDFAELEKGDNMIIIGFNVDLSPFKEVFTC